MQYDLPEIELGAVECRGGELFHWLNHLNAVVKEISNGDGDIAVEYLQGQIDKLKEQARVDKRDTDRALDDLSEDIANLGNSINNIEAVLRNLDERVRALEGRE